MFVCGEHGAVTHSTGPQPTQLDRHRVHLIKGTEKEKGLFVDLFKKYVQLTAVKARWKLFKESCLKERQVGGG